MTGLRSDKKRIKKVPNVLWCAVITQRMCQEMPRSTPDMCCPSLAGCCFSRRSEGWRRSPGTSELMKIWWTQCSSYRHHINCKYTTISINPFNLCEFSELSRWMMMRLLLKPFWGYRLCEKSKKSEDSMTLSNPTSGSVQISALGFLAAVFCCAASASSACEVIPISAQTAYVGIPTYPNKINQRLQQIPVIYCHLSTPSRCHRRCGWGGCTLSWRGIRHPGSTFSRMVDSQTSDG